MEKFPINVCFETLLFPSYPICSIFKFLLTVLVALHFQCFLHFDFKNMKLVCFSKILTLINNKIITKHNVGKNKIRYSCDLSLVEHVEVRM